MNLVGISLKLKNAPRKESIIEAEVLHYLHFVRKIFAWKNPTSGYFNPTRKMFVKHRSPYAINGVADILCCVHGHLICFEVKSRVGRQSDAQKEFEKNIHQAGGSYFVVRSMEEAGEAIDSVLDRIGKALESV